MGLMPAYYTTTKLYSKQKKKEKSEAQLQAEAKHRDFLKKMGVRPVEKSAKRLVRAATISTVAHIPSVDQQTMQCTPKQAPKQYTGERKLLGIAVMHKSNAVPVFADNKKVAVEISQMRRN